MNAQPNPQEDRELEKVLNFWLSKLQVETVKSHRPVMITREDQTALEKTSNGLNKALQQLIDRERVAARKQAASDIFNLAHEYAQQDKTLIGSEELRNYHYFNAIHKVGEFDGR